MYAYASSGLTARSIGASWNTPSGDGACFKFNDRDCSCSVGGIQASAVPAHRYGVRRQLRRDLVYDAVGARIDHRDRVTPI